MNYKSITELYLNDVKITNIETEDLERNREFINKHFVNNEEVTEIPVSSNFTFSISGTINKEDTAHATFLFDFPKEALDLKYYLGRKIENFGFNLPVILEKMAISHAGGGTVDFSASFKSAGPITPIQSV